MKLVDKNKLKEGSQQCKDICNDGSRCSRDAVRMGYCKQHFRLRREKGLIVDAHGMSPITKMPDIPDRLGPVGRVSFQVYCRYLMDQNRLFQIYLFGIEELCYLEEELQSAREDIKTYGAVNIYDSGAQVSGYATRYEKVLRDIRNLRKDYGLTAAAEIVASNGSADTEEESPKQGYNQRKSKTF